MAHHAPHPRSRARIGKPTSAELQNPGNSIS